MRIVCNNNNNYYYYYYFILFDSHFNFDFGI